MPSYVSPKKNTAFVFYIGLVSQADTKLFQSNPTLAAGDFTVYTDGVDNGALDTIPDVDPNSTKCVKISLSASEMNGDNIVVVCSDAAGAEWCDQAINIQTTARQVDDLAYPATSGRSLLVDSSGGVTLTNAQGVKKNTALANFEFVMFNSSGNPQTGLTVTATRSLDGGAFAACANSVSEVASGVYKISFDATDLNANVVVLRFTATSAKDALITILTVQA